MFLTESALWTAFQRGDVNAFEEIYRTHSAPLFAYGKRLCADHDLVQDTVQDIFVEIWTRRATLRNLHTIKYYLFRIMRNKLARLHQKAAVLVHDDELSFDFQRLFSPAVDDLITQQETSAEQVARLQQSIRQLPGRQREAIILAFYDNFSNEEIAGIMGINHQSVINHLNRGLTTLRDLLANLPALLAVLLNTLAESSFWPV
ncbi:RNA polymerase sigma factor [Spirosoma sp. KUDC1026]|uniref:RNA polymerase sigma factor n=1 Tax=Spirosoma sp. KUDC1026 TaxID=2745947 RepID=UPI00159B8BAE|nr:sigma-70 family RNA polymerase sigma factor [Spirosoma sp. KUDC1026]QKZ12177.1 sigma-70 family RNA polymerase sigma factor [Spirosoma sp. KUDC1026]